MLGDVGERLGGDVVGGRLDRRRQPLVESHVDVDRDVGTTRECSECRPEPGLGEDRGVDAARDLAQLVGDVLQAFRELCGDARQLVRRSPRHRACAEAERDQPLLDSVVQIALDPAARLVGGGHDPSARRGELGRALRVGDRRRDELAELLEPLFVPRAAVACASETVITPHRRPSTTIGLATVETMPRRRPDRRDRRHVTTDQSTSSTRTDRPVR